MKKKIIISVLILGVLSLLSLVPGLDELIIIPGTILGLASFFGFLFAVVWVVRKAWKG